MKMKLLVSVVALGLMAVVSSASAYMVDDNYHGSDAHGYGDVISGSGVTTYNVDGMDASLSGSELTVKIYTNFAGHAGIEPQWTTGNTGLGYGDLFLSTGWSPNGSGTYDTDNAANGNHWTYAFALDDSLNNSGGDGTVYELGSADSNSNNPDALRSNDFMNCSGNCIYRDGQEVAVDTSQATATNNTGTWAVGNGFLSFSFDITGLNLDPTKLGFHWGMYCANDVIEGLAHVDPVPEPAPAGLVLLGMGLIGVGVMRQRKTARTRG